MKGTQMAYLITYLKNGTKVGTTVIDSLEGEVADKALSNFGISFARDQQPDDFTITEGTVQPHPRIKGAVIFTAAKD
jgi:hypothetical protein